MKKRQVMAWMIGFLLCLFLLPNSRAFAMHADEEIEDLVIYKKMTSTIQNERLSSNGVSVSPHEELPLDVFLQVDQSERVLSISLWKNGQIYRADMRFTVRVPYQADRSIYLNSQQVPVQMEDDTTVFEIEKLSSLSLEFRDAVPVDDTTAVVPEATSDEVSVTALGGFAVLAFAIGTILLHTKRIDVEE